MTYHGGGPNGPDGPDDDQLELALGAWFGDDDPAVLRFVDHNQRNPHLYRAFRRLAFQVAERGRTHYSARTLLHVMRFHTALSEDATEFKINDHWSPFYARMFAAERPETRDLFRGRPSAADRLSAAELLRLVRMTT